MDTTFILVYSPVLIMFLSVILSITLLYLGKVRSSWEYYSLSIPAALTFFVYMYIFLYNPDFNTSKYIIRCLIIFALCDSIIVTSYKIRFRNLYEFLKRTYPFNKRGGTS